MNDKLSLPFLIRLSKKRYWEKKYHRRYYSEGSFIVLALGYGNLVLAIAADVELL
jgi:hypothetical protein